jgi:hypothetical protein
MKKYGTSAQRGTAMLCPSVCLALLSRKLNSLLSTACTTLGIRFSKENEESL